MNFFNFFYVFENTVLEKNWGRNRATVSSIPRKIRVCDMWSSYKTYPKFVTLRSICKIFKQIFENVEKNRKNSYGFIEKNK